MAKKVGYDLYGKLQIATIEREVEDAWNGGISLFFSDSPIEHPFACDGFISDGLMLRLIIEYKYDEKLSSAAARAKVLVQVLFYLKHFEEDGLPLPNVIMVADKNECFVIHTNDIQNYLDEDLDWTVAPSSSADYNPDLVLKIASDGQINPFIFTVGPGFALDPVINRIKDLSINVKRYVRVTEHNIAQIFEYYRDNVLRDPKKLSAHEVVEVFIGVLLNPMEYYQHPKNRNILVTPVRQVPIYGDAYVSFFDFYNQTYTPQEQMRFTEITDRLVEDVTRRRNGEFFTPTPFVDYAHRMLEEQLGEGWKDRYVVWDCCCGTKNLTRDYHFNELYCSTLNEEDIRLSERYNKEAQSFVFNFLEDPLDSLPQSLLNSFEQNRPICFILNPPYATAANNRGADGSSKEGVAKNATNTAMLDAGIGKASQNLYAQFLFRITEIKRHYSLTDCCIGLFCPTLFLCGPAWKQFRKYFFEEFNYRRAAQFKASHFADVEDSWAIAFSVWTSGRSSCRARFEVDLLDRIDLTAEKVGTKVLYNTDDTMSAASWLASSETTFEKVELPAAKSALNFSDKTKVVEKALGYFVSDANNVDASVMGCYFMSVPVSRHLATFALHKDNFVRCTALFAARKLVEKTWVNSKDEYLAPDLNNELYNGFCADSVVFSLFHSSSNQSSLRGVGFGGRTWDIHNEFFWMSKNEVETLANDSSNFECYTDAHTDTDRYVYLLLSGLTLSEEAQAVLQKASDIVRSTFKYRQLFNDEYPEYQINNWDAGWYQVKALASQYAKADMEKFRELFKALADMMRPKVYELGFLLK